MTRDRTFTPREIVSELDRYIVGQRDAKRSVAIALRNRWRRQQVPEELRDEIAPKNIIMIGPTGVGKTEIARRSGAPLPGSVHQGGSLEVHRGGLRGSRRGIDRPRSHRIGAGNGPPRSRSGRFRARPRTGPKNGCWMRCFRRPNRTRISIRRGPVSRRLPALTKPGRS